MALAWPPQYSGLSCKAARMRFPKPMVRLCPRRCVRRREPPAIQYGPRVMRRRPEDRHVQTIPKKVNISMKSATSARRLIGSKGQWWQTKAMSAHVALPCSISDTSRCRDIRANLSRRKTQNDGRGCRYCITTLFKSVQSLT
ncbi:hypothetical protein PV05_05454 [Exophiala xenobiotica]|uniref:Uncharacterized protein n=1 Tax=Exophiala xenobiotica TaxID=348802 RepID=A0A0D2EN42_9EURO|nr:uncharacterized protein PV05_05454 [Exophiala xenobiotica]KIW56833.1 hypothetical protein PV05_05454 [Exophiala xenobiotica]